MKRISEPQQDNFDLKMSEEYLNEMKNSSQVKFRDFYSALKKMDIKGSYMDVGCGPGLLTQKIALQHPEANIIGIDISKEMLHLANQELSDNLKKQISYLEADACNKETLTKLGSFDLIFSTFTMHHWGDANAALSNLYNLLKPGGVLYIHDLKRVALFYYIKKDTGFFNSIRASYRPNEIKSMMKELNINNFKIQAIFPYFMQSVTIRK